MAVTSPDNIWTPDSGDDYALTVDLARTADDIQDALQRRMAIVGSASARNAIFPSPAAGNAVFRTDLGYVERYYDNAGLFPQTGWQRDGGDTGWQTVTTFNNGFSSSTSEIVKFRRVGLETRLTGGLMRASAPTGGVIAFGIPPGYRPGNQVRVRMRPDVDMSVIVESNGAVTVSANSAQIGPSGVGYALNGISFLAEN